MKKHIFGLAVFSFIVGAAAIGYAIFNVPKMTKVYKAVLTPQYFPKEGINYKLKNEKKDISFEIISAQLDLKTGILISEVKLKWNGFGEPPEKITAAIHLFTAEDDEEGLFNERQVFIQPFDIKNEAIVLIKYKVRYDLGYNTNKNLYALIEFSQDEKFDGYIEGKEDLSKAYPVLFIHGDNLTIKQ